MGSILFAIRTAAWVCVAAVAYLSLVPPGMEVRTPIPAGVEHALAYAGTAGLMTLGYSRRSLWLITGALFAYSGVLEGLQAFVPGRHPEVAGALWSGAGALLGAYAAAHLRQRDR
jgi:VanZ family protein